MTGDFETKTVPSPVMLLCVEHVKFRKAGPGKSPIGMLCIYEDHVDWNGSDVDDENLSVPFSSIKCILFLFIIYIINTGFGYVNLERKSQC